MGLIGRPSEKLVEEFRNALRVSVWKTTPISAAVAFRCGVVHDGQFEAVAVRYRPERFVLKAAIDSALDSSLSSFLEYAVQSSTMVVDGRQFEAVAVRYRPERLFLRAAAESAFDSSPPSFLEYAVQGSTILASIKEAGHTNLTLGLIDTPSANVVSPELNVATCSSIAELSFRPQPACSELRISGTQPANADLDIACVGIAREQLHCVGRLATARLDDVSLLDVTIHSARLISTSETSAHTVNLIIKSVKTCHISFGPRRKEQTIQTTNLRPRPLNRSARAPSVRQLEPPPELKHATLEERLRWLLSPPIHEVLADPALGLPKRPYRYQEYGIKWLYDRKNGLLADEMGLGKTMQAILAARLLWRDGKITQILIVCPKSLIANWREELRTWWPSILPFTKIVERDREWALRQSTNNVAVKIINYESLPSELEWLRQKPPTHDLVIIDEAHRIKNAASKTSQAVKALKSQRRWALTGTPLENCIEDVISVFGFVKDKLLSTRSGEQLVRERIKPHMLRRRQEDVLKDLPRKIERELEIELSQAQRIAYDVAEAERVGQLNKKGDSITITHVFATINSLRQICNFDPVTGQSAKRDQLVRELEEILENKRKAIVFGHFVDEKFGLKRLSSSLRAAFSRLTAPLELHGQIPQRHRSGIVERFNNDPAHQMLLLNYRVGGVGLNLQAANYVFLFDRWWNPAVEDQAIKRCHRIGQKRTVVVTRFFCKDTIEERILKKLAEKRQLFKQVIDENRPAAAMGLTDEEVFSLFKDLTARPRRSVAKGSKSRDAAGQQIAKPNEKGKISPST